MSLTVNVDPAFDRAFPEACARIGCNPLHLLAVMMSESEVNPAAHNPHGDASGLIQFMPATLRGLGWRGGDQAFRCLSASQQLPYVEAYYRQWAKDAGAWDSAGRLYQATFLPGTMRESSKPEDVIAAHGAKLGWAFDANAVFDKDGSKTITLQELTDATTNAITRAPDRWLELCTRIGRKEEGEAMIADARGDSHGVVSARDVQRALNAAAKAGVFSLSAPLAEDGIPGWRTIAAVRDFQTASDLHADGRAGPATRAALAAFVS